ncbi:RAMP superfamily CRISPR-associated protein [Lachnospiraceae bacterium 46-15]
MKKVYYELKLKQTSPLRIGNGDNENTDSDLLLDGQGLPFISGSSVAGILRSMLPQEEADEVFGFIKGDVITESHILVSDAVLGDDVKKEDITISVRDGIELDDWGVTKPESKYDFEVAETEKEYTCVLEWGGEDNDKISKILEPLIQRIVKTGISAGARTTRGYGAFDVEAKKREFQFPADIDKWISFKPFAPDAFNQEEKLQGEAIADKDMNIKITIKIDGSFSVRVKTSDYIELEDGTLPKSVPLMNWEKKPVIPGTTWAGCFRHHMRDIIRELKDMKDIDQKTEMESLDLIFGKAVEAGKHQKSKILFSETEIEGGKKHVNTRNAVDRFTQAPKNTGLYTSAVWQGGKGTLHLCIKENAMSDFQKKLLAIALIDLDLGLMSFGGEAGVGRGRAEITELFVNEINRLNELKALKTDFLEVTS